MDIPISRSYCILSEIVVELGNELLRELFLRFLNEPMNTLFQKERIRIRNLLEKGIITIRDRDELLSPDVDAKNFDIALLYTLLTTFIPWIERPINGWTNNPDPKDFTIGADLIRLLNLGERVQACKRDNRTNDEEYIDNLRKEAKIVILRIAKFGLHPREQYYREMIDRISADH